MNVQHSSATTQPAPLLREMHGSIALLTLNRPAARNALSEALIAALHAEIDAIGANSAVRAVVIAANGPAFSAGHDLKELTARRSDARLVLEIADDGERPAAEPAARKGIGLSNVQARLEALYGPAFSLELRRPAAGGTCVRVALPLRRAGAGT